MNKIQSSINKVIAKAQEKRNTEQVTATIRQDVVRRAIERGEFEKIVCAYHYTDDYAWDAVNDFGRGGISGEGMLREYNILTPSCWVSNKVHTINRKKCYEVSISFHSNLAYDMYVEIG